MKKREGTLFVAVVAIAAAVCFLVPFVPHVPKEELVKTTLWSLANLGAYAGWGALLARACCGDREVPLSLVAVWGASAFAAFGGVLAAAGILSKWILFAFVAAGLVLLVREAARRNEEVAHALRVRTRAARLHLPVIAVLAFVAISVAVHYLGGAADVSSNPYDDDISYYPFAKQLLERGTLIDPFSFRRMSTLGGQALYQAVLLARVPILHLNVFDRAMCVLLSAGLLASHRIDGKRVPLVARIVSVLFLVTLPNTSINSASYYSGIVFFLALFQTLELQQDDLTSDWRAAVRRTAPLALVGAATCTLRQNYQATVGLFVAIAYGFAILKLRRGRKVRELLVEPVVACGLTTLFVLPWLALLYRSNLTFLFPIMKGTFRPGVDVRSQVMTVSRFFRFFGDCWFQPSPIHTLPLFMLVGLFVGEPSPRRPLASQWLAGFLSLVVLCWSFSLSDAGNLARYDYGFFTASALLTWQTVASRTRLRHHTSFRALVPGAILVFALFDPMEANTERTRRMFDTRLRDTAELLRRSVPMQKEPPVAAAYHALQNATPAGSRILILLDQPYHLDFARNEIWNLDMPGTASLPPGIPCFQGSEPVAQYLLSQGIRYVMFVESEHSTFLYKREIWVDHIWDPDEIWRVYAPYMTDVMDNLAALARTRKHMRDEAGMVLLDLQAKQ